MQGEDAPVFLTCLIVSDVGFLAPEAVDTLKGTKTPGGRIEIGTRGTDAVRGVLGLDGPLAGRLAGLLDRLTRGTSGLGRGL